MPSFRNAFGKAVRSGQIAAPAWVLSLGCFLGYAILFELLFGFIGYGVSVLIIIPVLVTVQLLGTRAGVVAAVGALVINLLLIYGRYGYLPPAFWRGGIPGHLVTLAAAIGWGQFRRINQKLAHELARRQDMERALQESEARFRHITENMYEGVGLHDLDGRYIYASPSFKELFGYDTKDLLGKTPFFLFHPDDLTVIRDPAYLSAIQKQQPVSIQNRIRHKDGRYVWTETRVQFVRDEQGKVLHLQTLTRDISEQKAYEEKLRESEARAQRLAMVAQRTHNGVVITNDAGEVEWINDGYTRMTGYALAEMVGQKPANVLQGPGTDQKTKEIIDRYLSRRQGFKAELLNYHKSGREFWVQIEAQPLVDENGRFTGYMTIESDITERKRYEAALKDAKEAAEEATRVKSDFLANMSHEIRTPMNAIIGLTSLLMDTPLNAEQVDFVQTLRASGEGLLTIINDILDFSKIEAGKLEIEQSPFGVRTTIEDALDLVTTKAAEKGLELAYFVEPVVPEILTGDVTRLRQILANLLSNAVKFTETGEIFISVKGERGVNGRFLAEFAVRDTGMGIPADRLSRLFQSFSQVDASTTRRFGGTGLGLVISKRLAEAMGGGMWVQSEVGQGTTFTFTITTDVCEVQPEPEMDKTMQSLWGKRVLAVDDNQTNRFILCHHLQNWHMVPTVVASGEEALALLTKGERFDAAILDMQMPEMDGITLARRIRMMWTQMPIPMILFTSIGVDPALDTAELFAARLNKPVKPAHLQMALQHMIMQRPQPAPQVHTSPFDVQMAESHPLHILLAEDNTINQKVALQILSRLGYRADVAANGLEVIQALHRQVYDVILMDVQMPELDGLETTVQIRSGFSPERQPHIIAVTANALKGDREKALDAGMDAYISKPIRIDELVSALEQCAPLPVPA